VTRAIREHLRDFLAVVALAALAVAVAIAILVQQGVTFPGWVPGVGTDSFELQAEFESAQAVTPGQGQTVNIAGIRVGEVTGVEVEDGRAIVTMQVRNEYAPLIRADATLLPRPRTGLQDMTIEVDTGSPNVEPVEEGATIPLSQTESQVQPDEILATLDAETRAYLKLLLNGAGEGLGGRGTELSAGLRRLEPFARDVARINSALAERRENLSRVIHNFRLLSEALAQNDEQLAQFVDSSNSVLGSFADQEAAIRASLRELPGALRNTLGALRSSDRFALELTPALRALRPAARAFGPAQEEIQPFFRRTRAPIRTQIRPFTREVRRPVRHLKGAADPLVKTTEGLRGGFTDLNRLLNMLAYNPPGGEEGYLFWLTWLNHNTNSLFLTQDATGPLRRGMILLSCQTAGLAEGVAASRDVLRTLQQLTNIPGSAEVC
jgi:phospholipid/cholesterol/gamma-HCH transport system substrate-binding protein